MDVQLITELTQYLGDRFSTSEHEQQQHGKDESCVKSIFTQKIQDDADLFFGIFHGIVMGGI